MPISSELLEELKLLSLYNLDTTQEGIKVHSQAEESLQAASKRLFDKNLVSQQDGGYLTELGREAAEHTQSLLSILQQG